MVPPLVVRATAPTDGAGLYAFRVLLGALMLADALHLLLTGAIDAQILEPAVRFSYPGLSWVEPLPGAGMLGVLMALVVASLALTVGMAARVAAAVLGLGHAYLFVLEASRYLNHAYLMILLALLMACMPTAGGLSIEAWRRPDRAAPVVPAWAPWLLRVQIAIVYVYGGLAKVNADWLAGEPVRGWLRQRARGASGWFGGWIGGWLDHELLVRVVVHGGLWFDLLVAPALVWRRTRALAVLASLGFHLANAWLFDLGVFPWLMVAATTLFLAPSWPRKVPWLGPWVDAWLGPVPRMEGPGSPRPSGSRRVVGLCVAWIAVQVIMPLRHHLYPGDVAWTEEGHQLAWRMKVRTKTGAARFIVHAPSTAESWVIEPSEELTAWQLSKLVGQPELVRQYAHHLAERWRVERGLFVEVRAQVLTSLNRRARRPLVDPNADLAREPFSLGAAPWILPGPREPVPGPP